MALFKRFKGGQGTPALVNDARPLHLVQSGSVQRVLALGMTWRTVMVAGGATTAMRMARAAKASHYCQIDGQVVGYGKIANNKGKPVPAQVYPAGTLAGRHCGGNAIFALTLSETEVWLLVVQNGRPSGMEEIVTADGAMSAHELAALRCQALIEAEAGITVYGDIDTLEFELLPLSMRELLEIAPNADDRLVALAKKGGFEGMKVPRPLVVAAVCGLAGYGTWTAWTMHEAAKLAEERAREAARIAREEAPEIVWKKAFETMRETHPQPSSASFHTVRKSFDALPAQWLGWTLKTAICKSGLPAQRKQMWTCLAGYEATAKSGSATNAQLKPTVPPGYTANFSPTRGLSLGWQVTTSVEPMVQDSLPTRADHLLNTASRLQLLIPALSEAPTMAFTPVKIDPPRGQKSKAVIPMPKALVIPSESKLVLRGPLRSIDAALGRGIHADWKSVQFTYNPSAFNTDSTSYTGLRQSTLQVEITGMIYAKD